MYNWDYNLDKIKKDQKYIRWHLERLINFGLGKEKLKTEQVKQYWQELKIDPHKKIYLEKILWPKESSLKNN